MLNRLRSRLTYANVMATIAMFVALGGSSYAAIKVGSKQIVNNSIRSKDIRNNQVSSSDVKNGSLLNRDFKSGQPPAGPSGPAGPTGPAGPRGFRGAPGSALAFAEVASTGLVDESSARNVTDANVTNPIGGVYCFDNLPFVVRNVQATPLGQQNRWTYGKRGTIAECEVNDDAVVKTGPSGSTQDEGSISVLFN